MGCPFFSWTVASPSEQLHNMATKASRTLYAHCADTGSNPIVFVLYIIAPRHMIDSEKSSNRCSHNWQCNRSLDGNTLQCHLYYYSSTVRKNLSSKFDEFLAGRSQFDSDYLVDFYAHTCCQSATSGPFFAFYCTLSFYGKK